MGVRIFGCSVLSKARVLLRTWDPIIEETLKKHTCFVQNTTPVQTYFRVSLVCRSLGLSVKIDSHQPHWSQDNYCVVEYVFTLYRQSYSPVSEVPTVPSTSSTHTCTHTHTHTHTHIHTQTHAYSGGTRILKRGVRNILRAKSGKNFCLTMPSFSETKPIKSPVYLVHVHSHEE